MDWFQVIEGLKLALDLTDLGIKVRDYFLTNQVEFESPDVQEVIQHLPFNASPWTDLIFSTTLEERIFDNLHLKGVLNMAKGQRLKPEQIVTLLRQIDVLTTNGKTLAQACKEVGTVEQSYYRWRKIYGGMKVDQALKYKDLELENTRLKKLVADLSLREVMLKEVIKGNF